MSETEFPSKTDSEPTQPQPAPVVEPTAPQQDVVQMTPGELAYMKGMQERNKFLTTLLGDKMMAVAELQEELISHREAISKASSFVLTAHGLAKGKLDLENGLITVLERA